MKKYLFYLTLCVFISCQSKEINRKNTQENQAKIELYKLYSNLSCQCEGQVESLTNQLFKNEKFKFLASNVNIDTIIVSNDTLVYYMHFYPYENKGLKIYPHNHCTNRTDYYAIAFKKGELSPIFYLADEEVYGIYNKDINTDTLNSIFKECVSQSDLNKWLQAQLK